MSDEAVPEFLPVLPRTKSEDITTPMHMIDHTCARLDGPPDFAEEEDTEVDTLVVDVEWEHEPAA